MIVILNVTLNAEKWFRVKLESLEWKLIVQGRTLEFRLEIDSLD